MSVDRRSVDLSGYPDLSVICLGMRVSAWRGLKTVSGFGPQIEKSWNLLLHENVIVPLVPLHAGMRQYGRDYASLERWTRSEPHRIWWQTFLRDSGGTGFWHEAYFMRGGMEAIYDDMNPVGFMKFAPVAPARGSRFSARARIGHDGAAPPPAGVSEADLYDK